MAANFVSRKLSWLEAIARDRSMPRSAVVVAALLATHYFNGKTGEAWPSERTLAIDTGMTPANVRMGIDRLVDARLLVRTPGGPRTSNRYRIPRRWKVPERPCQQGRSALVSNSTSAPASNSAAPLSARPEPGKEPVNGTPERTPGTRRLGKADGTARSVPRHAAGQQQRSTRLPPDWTCGDAELADARDIASWEPERARAEFERFLDYHRSEDTRGRSWSRYWRNWCRKGAEIDQRERDRPRRPGSGREFWDARSQVV